MMRGRFRVRFLYSPLIAAFLAFSLAWLSVPHEAAAATTSVTLSASSQTVARGDRFTASVVVAPVAAIAGVQFDLSFDPSLVTVTGIEEGNLLKQDGASTFFNPGAIDNQAGSISGVFGTIISPGQSVSAQGTFATIGFTAGTQTGACPLRLLNVVVGDTNGASVPLSVTGGTVSIGNSAPVLRTIGNRSVSEGSLLSFTISATDADGDSLTYSASNLPSGSTFNPATRTFSWTPGYDRSGTYAGVNFQVSDGLMRDSEDITITVINRTSVSLSAPTLYYPGNRATTWDHTPYLDWSTVTAASSVHYQVQIDNNSNFSSPVVSKTWVSYSSYTVTKSLVHGTYYWRVRAVDASGKMSSWTASRSFTVK